MRKIMLAAGALLLLAPAPAAAGGGGGGLCSGFSEGTDVVMLDSCFEGVTHFAPAGATVQIRNDGRMDHTYTAVDGSFDSGLVAPGDTFEIAVDDPGIVRVFCTLHGTASGQGMAGVLIVGEPTPDAMAGIDTANAVRDAVAAAMADVQPPVADRDLSGEVVAAMDRQTRAVNKMADGQAALHQRLDDLAAGTEPPTISNAEPAGWLAALAGAGFGLGLAAVAGVALAWGRWSGRAVPRARGETGNAMS